jgi:hypothetical protein
MRSVSITALMILAAFVLGLAIGGHAPREAAAAPSVGISWKTDGETLVLANLTQDKAFFVNGALREDSNAPAPPLRTDGILEISGDDLDKILISRLEPVYICNGLELECRSCDEMPALCPVPPRPLPEDDATEVNTLMGQQY